MNKAGLVEVVKGKSHIFIHPSALESHKKAGWTLANPKEEAVIKADLLAQKQKNSKAVEESTQLVRMSKAGQVHWITPFESIVDDDEYIEVHPSNVAEHQRLGWKVIG